MVWIAVRVGLGLGFRVQRYFAFMVWVTNREGVWRGARVGGGIKVRESVKVG